MARRKKSFLKKLQYKYLFFVTLSLLIATVGLTLGINYPKAASFFKRLTFVRTVSEEISPRNFMKILAKKDFVLVNVHTPYEGEVGKTDLFINYDEMMTNEDKLPKNKNAKIVLYCKSGRMSTEALMTLKSMGYTNVSELAGGMNAYKKAGGTVLDLSTLSREVLPEEGFELPFSFGTLGPKLISLGVIDKDKFSRVVKMDKVQKTILEEGSDEPLRISFSNSQFMVDVLWAVGLAQKSKVYIDGPMGKEYKKDVGNFASTGGWTLAKGDALDYLNKFDLVDLSDEQQERVVEIAKNVYRPCCGNSTWFPDCNHGMAALAAIELMVAQNIPDEEIYKNVLKLNSFWFPDTYLISATYFARDGKGWADVDAKEVLGEKFSSGKGAAEISKKVGSMPYDANGAGGSCGA